MIGRMRLATSLCCSIVSSSQWLMHDGTRAGQGLPNARRTRSSGSLTMAATGLTGTALTGAMAVTGTTGTVGARARVATATSFGPSTVHENWSESMDARSLADLTRVSTDTTHPWLR